MLNNIMNTKFLVKMLNDLKGHIRSPLFLKFPFFLNVIEGQIRSLLSLKINFLFKVKSTNCYLIFLL